MGNSSFPAPLQPWVGSRLCRRKMWDVCGFPSGLVAALSSLSHPPGLQPLRFARLLLGAPQPAGESGSPGDVGGSEGPWSDPGDGVRQRLLPRRMGVTCGWGSRSLGPNPRGGDGMGGAHVLGWKSQGNGEGFLEEEPPRPSGAHPRCGSRAQCGGCRRRNRSDISTRAPGAARSGPW